MAGKRSSWSKSLTMNMTAKQLKQSYRGLVAQVNLFIR